MAATAVVNAQEGPPPPPQPAPPAASTPLPPVVVETSKQVAPAAKKKKKAASKSAVAPTVVAQPAPAGTTGGTSAQESGTGPMNGYVATQTTSGTKTDTPIVEIPRSVDVVTRDQMEAQQPKSLRDAVAYTPGVQNQTGAGSMLDNIAVRGFTAPIYLNGLLLPSDTAVNFNRVRLEPYNLERLEILKGPPSGLFGQSPPGGLINAISKRPQFLPHNEVYVQYGTDDYKETGFDFTGPVSADAAFRLVGVVRDTDLDFDFADRQRYFLAPSLTFRPSDDTTLTVMGTVQRDSGFGPHQFVPLALTRKNAPFGRISRSTYLGEPGYDDYEEDTWTLGYELEHRFNAGLKFRQNLRYSDSSQDLVALRTNGLIAGSQRRISRDANGLVLDTHGIVVDNQLQANVDWGPTKHRILAGLDYQRILAQSGFWSRLNAASSIDAYNPVHGVPPLPSPFIFAPTILANTVLNQTGVYLQDQIKFGSGWIATIGGRQDFATTNLDDVRPQAVPTPRFQEVQDEAFTSFAGLSYLFDSGLAPYVNYSTSFLPASGNNLLSSTNQPLKPTTGEGYEAGIKYQPWGTNTLLTAAVFQITQQNVKSTDPVTRRTEQTGEVRVRGFEVEGKTSLTDNFDLIAGYGYIEPVITETLPLSNIGHDFQQISRHTASAWGMYTWHDGAFAGLGLGAGIRYVSSQFPDNTNRDKVPGFTLVDAAISYDLKYMAPGLEGTKLQLNAYNLFDEYYVATCVGGSNFCQLGETRTFLATIKYDW
jgi:iron complex outermembrane receptor protein